MNELYEAFETMDKGMANISNIDEYFIAVFVLLAFVILFCLVNMRRSSKIIDLLEEQNELLWEMIEGGGGEE